MIKNLGQVASIYIGDVAPSNTTIIWCNPTILPYSFKVWGGTSWVDLATQEWVKITIGGYLISLPAKTIANDNDYLIINDGTNDNKIKVVDFVRSAVGNPLDFKGVIRVAADFPAPAALEGGDMYIIITSPSGGTVTDPYSGKTFKDTEKIVWDSVTNSWESLGLVKIEVNLGVDTKEDSVIITNTAGSSATIPTASASKAGVMSSQLLRWLTNLINGTTVLATPDPSNPNIPAHRHNYLDLVNYPAIYQTLGQSTEGVMSQKAVTDTFSKYLPLTGGSSSKMSGPIYFRNTNFIYDSDGNSIVVTDTNSESVSDHVSAFGALTGKTYLRTRAGVNLIHQVPGSAYTIYDSNNLPNPATEDDLNNYLPLSAGSNKKLTGELYFSQTNMLRASDNNIILYSEAVTGASPGRTVIGNYSNRFNILTVGTDVLHNRVNNDNPGTGTPYKMWDAYNLPNPAKSTDLDGYLPLTAGATKPLTGQLFANQGVNLPFNVALRATNEAGDLKNVIYSMTNNKLVVGDASYDMLIASTASDLIHSRTGTPYKIWDAYNLSNPAKQNGTYSQLTAGKVQGTITFTNGSTTLGTYNGSTDLTVNVGGGQPSGDYLPLTAGPSAPLTGKLYINVGARLLNNKAIYGLTSQGNEYPLIHMSSNDNVTVGTQHTTTILTSSASDLIHKRGASAEYKIWDAYNLSSPAKTSDLANYIPRAAENNAASLLTKPGGIYRQGASVDGEFGYSCNMLLRFDSGGTNWYTGGILSISTGGELRVAGVSNGTLSVWRDVAMQGMSNNFLHSGNEVTFISQTEALSGVWLNYRGCAGGITDYHLGSGKADGSYANLKVKNLYTSESIYIPNGQKLKSYSSEGNIVDMAYVAPGSDVLVLGHLSTPWVLIRSTNTDIYHARNVGGTATNYKIWDAYNLSSPVTGSGGVAGQLAKWSAATALSGGIAYASANTAAALVARDGNGAFSASTVTTTNANITNLNPAGGNCVVQSGLIPRATSTCFLGSASRMFQNIYGNNIYVGATLLPVTTATVNIGTADLTYKSGYIQTIHTGGVLPLTTASSVGSSANPFSSMFATTFNGSATKWNGLSQQVVSSLPSTLTPNTMYFVTA